MKIGPQSQTLVSLTSLLDASKQQQQALRDDVQEKKATDGREGRIAVRQNERDELIQQNRDALKKVQDDIRLNNLRKLQQSDELGGEQSKETNLNLRESFTSTSAVTNQPTFERPGQIVDIKV